MRKNEKNFSVEVEENGRLYQVDAWVMINGNTSDDVFVDEGSTVEISELFDELGAEHTPPQFTKGTYLGNLAPKLRANIERIAINKAIDDGGMLDQWEVI